jgi:CHASE2 domain-containing sensor protein
MSSWKVLEMFWLFGAGYLAGCALEQKKYVWSFITIIAILLTIYFVSE